MCRLLFILVATFCVSVLAPLAVRAAEVPTAKPFVRELFVPFDDLNVVLSSPVERVFVTREQYEDLLAKAQAAKKKKPLYDALLVAADYSATVEGHRARITGKLTVDCPDEELHAVDLGLSGVGVRKATLDGKDAPIGRSPDGKLTLFVSGAGKHALVLEMLAPLETAVAQQSLSFQLPTPPAASLQLTVPGYVEIKGGAQVIRRTVDEKAQVTRFDLLPAAGPMSLVMSLNNRQLRKERVVVARSVLVDELTEAYERLHATVSLGILHGATDQFRFTVPEGFEVTTVASPLLARWAVETKDGQRTLEVQLREATTETVTLNISAVRTPAKLAGWSFPKLEPLDVAGQVAVVGLLVENRLKAQGLTPAELIPIDSRVLTDALPKSVLEGEPGTPAVRPLAAYYAPQASFSLKAEFEKPPVELQVRTSTLLTLNDKLQQVHGGFALLSRAEKLFAIDFSAPPQWQVDEVTFNEQPLAFETSEVGDEGTRIHARLPRAAPPSEMITINFHAVRTPAGWLGDWKSQGAAFPVFAVSGAMRDTGAIAVQALDDMVVRPEKLEGLTPLDDNKKAEYGLAGVPTTLAYRYEAQPYTATLTVERTVPRITARTYSFLRIAPDLLVAHYELIYEVEEARTSRLAFLLPASTPADFYVRGLDGVAIKEFTSVVEGDDRRWTVQLAEARRGTVRLAVDFQDRVGVSPSGGPSKPAKAGTPTRELTLPLVRATDVAYQSGTVAVEGSAELDVQVTGHPRKVDVGELAEAEYQPGRRLLGAFAYAGEQAEVKVSVTRQPGYGLPTAIVERAELVTLVSAGRESQTAARFLLRTKALLLEVRLPEGSTLWSAMLDGKPTLPQREKQTLLLSLPAQSEASLRDLQIVYESPVSALGLSANLELPAPKLLLRADRSGVGSEVPVANLQWHLHLPSGYRLVRSSGTVFTKELGRRGEEIGYDTWSFGYINATGGRVQDTGPAARASATQTLPAGTYLSDDVLDAKAARETDARQQPLSPKIMVQEESESQLKSVEAIPGKDTGRPMDGEKTLPMPTAKPEPAKAPATTQDPFGKPDEKGKGEQGGGKSGEGKPNDGYSIRKPSFETKTKAKTFWALEGVRSLKIDLQGEGQQISFESLGEDPELSVTLVDARRLKWLATGLALLTGLVGLAILRRPLGHKIRYVLLVLVVTTLLPLVTPWQEALAEVLNPSFWVALMLIVLYVLTAPVVWLLGEMKRLRTRLHAPAATAAVLIALGLVAPVLADPPLVHEVPPIAVGPPVHVPADAVIIPYDPTDKDGAAKAEKLFVPYEKYVELWNLAYPDRRLTTKAPPAPYALAGAAFTATLAEGDDLLLSGYLDLDVFVDRPVTVPLPLVGGVLAQATIDGKPALVRVINPALAPPSKTAKAMAKPAAPPGPLLVVYTTGKGRQRLELGVRFHVAKRGGWRIAGGRLPVAPATALTLRVPKAGTEVQLSGIAERGTHETKKDDETIETAIAADGTFQIQWRAKAAQGEVEQGLTVESDAIWDVQEDGLRLVWQLTFEFRRNQRDSFTIDVPADHLVEKVTGENVRGWQAKAAGARQQLEVTLLKAATDKATFAVHLARRGAVGQGELAKFKAPAVLVPEAMLHQGNILIRRSPLLDLRTLATDGVTRTDTAAARPVAVKELEESPLGIQPYQAYRFVTAPFTIELSAAPVVAQVSADLQTVLRVAERERTLESRVNFRVQARPLYRVELAVPSELKIERVTAPEPFEWTVSKEMEQQRLTVLLASGQQGEFSIVLGGTIPQAKITDPIPLPRLNVLGVDRQEGDIVIQADPVWNVRAEQLVNCETAPLARTSPWLTPQQQQLARLAIHCRSAQYSGTVQLTARKPVVNCFAVTNVRVTERAFEETIFLEFSIRDAGIREISFLLPQWMKDARITVPMLRQKTVTPVEGPAGGDPLVRVKLELQDEVMGQFRVVVNNDRLLTAEKYTAPIPIVEKFQTDRRYVALESAGRDEVIVDTHEGLDLLSPQQTEWRMLADLLKRSMTQAYLVREGAEQPRLVFHTKDRAAVETAGARIGLASLVLVLDENGAYRASQTYFVDNSVEQFLVVQLPEGAVLWTAHVAGEAVKPTDVPGSKSRDQVRIPLIKTAAGERDFAVVLKYGGRMAPLGTLRSVRFPVMRTLNINVELSKAQLHLPESYDWFMFGGTMRRVTDEGDLAAVELSYENKQLEKLSRALQSSNEYTQARAKANLKQLSLGINAYQPKADYNYNPNFRQEWSANARAQQQVEAQIAEQRDRPMAQQDLDNRVLLNELVEQQQITRSRNIVTELGRNFEAAPPMVQQAQPQRDPSRFNSKWLEQNGLENPETKSINQPDAQVWDALTKRRQRYAPGEQPAAEAPKPADPNAPAQQGQMQQFGRPQADQPAAPEVAQGKAKKQVQQLEAAKEGQQPMSRATSNKAELYEKKLESQVANQSGPAGGQKAAGPMADFDALALPQTERARLAPAAPEDRQLLITETLAVHDYRVEDTSKSLASLDVTIPERGTAYSFTTPRGDVEITAEAVYSPLISRLVRLLVALVVLAVLMLGYRAIRQRSSRRTVQHTAAS